MAALTVRVVDEKKTPLSGRRVSCGFLESFLGVADTYRERHADARGVAEFEDVPAGAVQVFVDGRRRLTLRVGMTEHKDVTVVV